MFPTEIIAVEPLTQLLNYTQMHKHSKTSFEKNCFSAWASTLNMGLINKVNMVDEGLTLETSAKHNIPQATNIPY